jgi:transaldolase
MEHFSNSLGIKLFADGADLKSMIEMASKPYISGLTTNPTLMKKAGVSDYVKFAKEVIREIPDKPISFEVFSDEPEEMKVQAIKIASWGQNVNVKIPITNTKGIDTSPVIREITKLGVKVNVTAVMTLSQVSRVILALDPGIECFISVFAGRIADTGVNPIPIMADSLEEIKSNPRAQLIWASPRELLNVFQAESIGCHIITATNDILKKLELVGYDLDKFSLDTVKMFFNDAVDAGYTIP